VEQVTDTTKAAALAAELERPARKYTLTDAHLDEAAAMLRALAARVEALEGASAAYIAASEAGWRETCEVAAKQGITSAPIGPALAASITQFHAFRAVVEGAAPPQPAEQEPK